MPAVHDFIKGMDLGASEVRKISITLALMSVFSSWGAYALGIGDIRLHSSLNEPMNAEIPLVTSDTEELSDIRVTLASPEAFARAHLDRNYLLTKLRFTAKKNPNGSYVISVSSKEPIREPFLDFMIEIYWPEGRLLREFTVLLDPPDSFQEATAANNEDDVSEPEGGGRFAGQPEDRPPSLEPIPEKPRRRILADTGRSVAAKEEPMGNVTGTSYGPVNRNETLSSIASQFQYPNLSPRQMLLALYRANPQAFYKPSMDALKAGATITIPDQDSIGRILGTTGFTQEPQKNGRPSTNAKTQATEPPEEASTESQLTLLAPSESKSSSEPATTVKKGKTGKSKEDLAIELADAAKQENESFRKRLADLDQQLSAMQRLLASKDEQIAALQAQLRPPAKEGQQAAPLTAAMPPHPPEETAPPPSASQVVAPANPQVGAPTPEMPNVSPPVIPKAPEVRPTPQSATRPAMEQPPLNKPPRATTNPPAQKKPVESTMPAKEEGILANLLDQPYYLIGGATGLLLLGVLWQFRRRRSLIIEDTESILTLTEKDKGFQQKQATPEPSIIVPNASEQSSVFRSSFLSEFTPSDFDALGGEMQEVDPISEADVYLAYGRYKQAEDLILGSLAQNSERDDCWLKLFEIHYATENAQAFEQYAQQLAPSHMEAKPDFWEKIVEMGRELCPSSPLFKYSAPLSPEPNALSSSTPAEPKKDAEEDVYLFSPDDDGLESYDYPANWAHSAESAKNEPAQDVGSAVGYDFFSTDESEDDKIKPSRKPTGVSTPLDVESKISLHQVQAFPAEEAIETPDESMEDMLAKLGTLSESESLRTVSEEKLTTIPDIDSMQNGGLVGEEEGVYPSEEYDDFGSKLDLAKAYYDLGDAGTAQTILQNVLELGNSEQKSEAKALLDKFTI